MTAPNLCTREPLPIGFRVRFDPSTKEIEPGVWLGGQPLRVMRVTNAGRAAWDELRAGPVTTRAGGVVARRLIDAGLAHPVPPGSSAMPAVTVVIPVHDRASDLDRCLTALGRAHPVIIVDDASDAAAAVQALAERHGATLIRLPVNRGPAGARNAGLAAVTTDVVAFVDSDTLPRGDWIAALVTHLEDPLVGAAAPRVTPLAGDGWAGRFTATRSALDLGEAPASVRPYGRVSYVPTAAFVARRSALASIAGPDGPFDAALRVGEDVDLVWRLLDAGWRVRYEPEITVAHREPRTWVALLRRRFGYGTSTAALARRHPENTAPFIVHRWFTATALAALAARPLPALAAFTGALLTTRRAVRRAGLPPRRVLGATADGVRQTWLGIGRYATQFAAPPVVVAAAFAGPRRKVAAASLLLGPALTSWATSDRGLDPVRYTLGSIADDMAYGAGVVAGCLRWRTVRPLIPLLTKPEITT